MITLRNLGLQNPIKDEYICAYLDTNSNGGNLSKDEMKQMVQHFMSKKELPKLSMFVKLVTFSYLDLKQTIQTIRVLDKNTHKALNSSEIHRDGKDFKLSLTKFLGQKCILHDNSIVQLMNKLEKVVLVHTDTIELHISQKSKKCRDPDHDSL